MSHQKRNEEKRNVRKYKTFNYPQAESGGKTLLTGIRSVADTKNEVYISGFYEPPTDQKVKSFIYKGDLCGFGDWYELDYPSAIGRTVTATNLYGPNNKYSHSNKYSRNQHNKINVVGNYVTVESQNSAIGCLYRGNLDGSGKWTTLTPIFSEDSSNNNSNNDTVINTIAHSNMGRLVVGNYDTKLIQGKAFIYDMKKKIYHKLEKSDAISITAYGIWYNGCNSYTICGGYKSDSLKDSEAGYLVDWDNETLELTNWRSYYYNNDPVKSRITHFDGITGSRDGYNLTGDWLGLEKGNQNKNIEPGFFAKIRRNRNGKFGRAEWSPVKYPLNNSVTSGNSVDKNIVIGVYTTSNGINGYISKL